MDQLFSRQRMLIESARVEGSRVPGVPPALMTINRMVPEAIFQAQRWQGSAQTPTPNEGTTLIRVQLPRELARDWTIQLGTTRPVIFKNPPSNLDGGDTRNALVNLTWGHNGSMDSVVMSWPSKGSSFSIYASNFELSVVDAGLALADVGVPSFLGATYNAWVDEGRRPDVGDRGIGPVLSQLLGTQVTANTALGPFAVPARARSFLPTWNVAPPFAQAFQIIGFGRNETNIAAVRVDGFSAGRPNDMCRVMPVPYNATQWFWQNTEPAFGANSFQPTMHWFLDLG